MARMHPTAVRVLIRASFLCSIALAAVEIPSLSLRAAGNGAVAASLQGDSLLGSAARRPVRSVIGRRESSVGLRLRGGEGDGDANVQQAAPPADFGPVLVEIPQHKPWLPARAAPHALANPRTLEGGQRHVSIARAGIS
jgi:hypothetical protein